MKQKAIAKLEAFLKKSSFDSELFDTETAIKVCRELAHTDLALKLAEDSKHVDLYLKILVEDRKEYGKALDFIRLKLELEKKIKYLREFGQILMKNLAEQTLEFIIKLVSLSTLKKTKGRSPNNEEKELLVFLKLGENDWERLGGVNFPKPDEFLHLFVVNNEHLAKYLNFLKNLKSLPNEKAILHRLFEYYLEDYFTYYVTNHNTLKYRQTKDNELAQKEKQILDLLGNTSLDGKLDKTHLLILFKMYQFTPGIIILCEQMQLRDELLNFYIENNESQKIIELCKKYGNTETNLWVQALKYFTRPDGGEDKIEEILGLIEKIESLSPLLILSILSKNKNVKMGMIRNYFMKKIRDDKMSIDKDRTV